ncbi:MULTISPECIES: 2-dehydropantoate 2-reductase [Exiguobacterium]|uniref:2-dehydropantoate 2-reductase n=1 Tax=Exiguobacterium TaxID=33986 RepID=UPI001BE5C82D|nr:MULTISPECIES: 2-dehydropantoate 2-reductase [Exiguobacterium]MCT4776289.1 2-dehydropantoate 2-reductase [Exiguobacterium aquaticum]MCT4789584.1 2-dehydropantoate 2-reductase [Exiguobacterium mexicanum]
MKPIKRIGIIGNGAVGMLMASLFGPDYTVTLYGRVDEASTVTIDRTGVTSGTADVRLVPVSTLDETEQDVFFVTTKAHQVEAATERLSGEVPVFICSNGIAHLDYARERGFHLGVVEHGVSREGNRLHHTGLGRIRIGSLDSLEAMSFSASPLAVVWEADIEQVVTEKLFANAIINPITALCRVENGAVAVPPCRDVATAIYEELTTLFDRHVPYTYIDTIIDKTAHNRSSMLRDIEAGRQTEVDAILTPLLKRADERGVTLTVIPVMQKLILGASVSC